MTAQVAPVSPAVVSLLRGLVDYAGLFPPAQLGMPEAVAAYGAHRREPDAWMLGRFVVPAARLPELARAAAPHLPAPGDEPWRVSAIVGPDPRAEALLVGSFNDEHAGRIVIDALEAKARTPEEAREVLSALVPGDPSLRSGGTPVFIELPLSEGLPSDDLMAFLEILKARGARAKVRTGGLTAEAFPPPALLARFLCACAESGVAFKATAGLHHPVRSAHAFTYARDSARGTMHGFLNVFVAAALVAEGLPARHAERLLLEERPEAFVFEGESLAWEGRRIGAEALARARQGFALSFGSCSFAEPVHDLRTLGLL
jgi:hypothetical protein